MRMLHLQSIRPFIAGLLLLVLASTADAQVRTTRPGLQSKRAGGKPSKTEVTVELLSGTQGVGLAAQQWQQTFAKLGIRLRIRRPLLDDKPEVREQTRGTFRQVTVIGRLDRSGKIILPDRTFRRSDVNKLKEWIDELKTYGAKGAPEGKPLWGLSKAQFASIYSALSEKLPAEVEELPFQTALSKMELPPQYPVRITTAAAEWLRREFPRQPPVRYSLKGMSKGTALAILVNDYGLGYRPLRTPDGSIELAIDPLTKTTDVWPVGWKLSSLEKRKAVPKLYELVPVELDDLKLSDVLHAVAVKTDVPIHVDYYRIQAKGIDFDKLRVSHPMRQTSWSLLLKRLTNPARLTRQIWRDESGQPFVWVTTLEPRKRQR